MNRLYTRITADHRHTGPVILDYARIRTRAFSAWSMKLVRAENGLGAVRKSALLPHLGDMKVDLTILSAKSARTLLIDLAALEAKAYKVAALA